MKIYFKNSPIILRNELICNAAVCHKQIVRYKKKLYHLAEFKCVFHSEYNFNVFKGILFLFFCVRDTSFLQVTDT